MALVVFTFALLKVVFIGNYTNLVSLIFLISFFAVTFLSAGRFISNLTHLLLLKRCNIGQKIIEIEKFGVKKRMYNISFDRNYVSITILKIIARRWKRLLNL